MADQGSSKVMSRRDSSSSSAPRDSLRPSRRDEDVLRPASKRSSDDSDGLSGKRLCPSPQPGTSQQPDGSPHRSTVNVPAPDYKLDLLTNLLHGLVEKLDQSNAPIASSSRQGDFSGFHDLSSSVSDAEEVEEVPDEECDPDPLDGLETALHTQSVDQPAVAADGDNADFLKALSELSDNFVGEEAKGAPISDCLATIVNASLRRRPVADSVKSTANKFKVPSNVPNMKVPETNPAIVKAMSVGGKLVDARLTYANGLLIKALVPIVQCLSDIGEKKCDRIHSYLEDLSGSLRLLLSATNYLNHLRKEVARIHVNDTALAELCKWECDVGTDSLFPFDVVKKCDEIHRTKKLGRPSFRPYRTNKNRSFVQNRQDYRRPYTSRAKSRFPSRPFLGQRQSQGRRTQPYKAHQ